MLSRAATKALVQAGKLVPVKSLATWEAEPRAFLMVPELVAEIANGRANPDEKISRRWAKLEADMAHFVEGGYVNWNLMKWLDPQGQEVWELKSVRPKPSIRVFGRFAEPDVFVGTHSALRTDLKAKWSVEFWNEIFKCETMWKGLTDEEPFKGKAYTDYITENAGRRVGV
jgi:hypothetical protein